VKRRSRALLAILRDVVPEYRGLTGMRPARCSFIPLQSL
jgi:hypothetical protein